MTHLIAAALGAAAALTGMALVGWWLAAEVVDESDDAGDGAWMPVGLPPADARLMGTEYYPHPRLGVSELREGWTPRPPLPGPPH